VNAGLNTLQVATLAVHRARSLVDLESSLKSVLSETIPLSYVRIRFPSQSAIPGAHHQALSISGKTIGELVIVPSLERPLGKADLELLRQLSETTALAVDRLIKIEQAEVLKAQWQATFDSILEPLCLTDSQYRILRMNRTFSTAVNMEFRELVNKNCFEVFFDKSRVPEFFALGPSFKVARNRWNGQESRAYEITVQPLKFESFDGEVVLVLFRDITEIKALERQVLESSKMAELGLIGSSIAHELNNPLGGMLSFIQLIRMGLKGSEAYGSDVHEMESAAQRCREIVQHLLGFARKGDVTDRRPIDLREILEQTVQITSLQTRSQGIQVKLDLPDEPVQLNAQSNQLTQSLCNLMQNATDAILERRKSETAAPAKIDIQLRSGPREAVLEIRDTGVGIAPEVQKKIFNPLFSTKPANMGTSGLGLTIAYRILSEHLGRLEILSQPGVGTSAKITFTLPDLSTESQEFDGKI
jgi:two-component system, NtrC family, sensor kinase